VDGEQGTREEGRKERTYTDRKVSEALQKGPLFWHNTRSRKNRGGKNEERLETGRKAQANEEGGPEEKFLTGKANRNNGVGPGGDGEAKAAGSAERTMWGACASTWLRKAGGEVEKRSGGLKNTKKADLLHRGEMPQFRKKTG